MNLGPWAMLSHQISVYYYKTRQLQPWLWQGFLVIFKVMAGRANE